MTSPVVVDLATRITELLDAAALTFDERCVVLRVARELAVLVDLTATDRSSTPADGPPATTA